MRILNTILMLCLPVASFAETWFCETDQYAEVAADGGSYIGERNHNFVIDTERGFRRSIGKEYEGSCGVEKNLLTCNYNPTDNDGEIFSARTLTIDLGSNKFVRTSVFITEEFTSEVILWFGTCTKA